MCSPTTEMIGSTLLLILCISHKITTTSCSKVPQGLSFPLDVSGLCTRKYFQKAPIRDSDNLVKPFMQVAIHTTRYYATLRASELGPPFEGPSLPWKEVSDTPTGQVSPSIHSFSAQHLATFLVNSRTVLVI